MPAVPPNTHTLLRMATWGEFRSMRPDLAAAGHRLFYNFGIGLGFLATVRSDGGPRVHPICPILTDDHLYGLILPGPKLNDLRRDRRFALHSETCPPPNQDDGFYVTGVPAEVTDPSTWEQVASQFLAEREVESRGPGFEEQVLFEFLLDRCLLTLTQPRDGLPAGHTIWKQG
jgi:hypothetical protein